MKRIAEYLIGMALIPMMALACVEGLLHIFDKGESRALFLSITTPSGSGYARNPLFYFQFFPYEVEESAYAGRPEQLELTAEPTSTTCRMFVLGGSVAFGDMPDPAFSFPRILEVMLEDAFPGLTFEMHNLAAPALNSHVMRLAALESLALAPDFYLVYMGNNEYIGPYGPAWAPGGMPASARRIHRALRRQQFLQRFRTVRLAMTARRAYSGTVHAIHPRQYFENSRKIAYESPERHRMHGNFRDNLEAIVHMAGTVGAETVVSTIGVNLRDWPPLVSFHATELTPADSERWHGLYHEAMRRLQSHSHDADGLRLALAMAREASAMDSGHAGLSYLLGQIHWQLEEYDDALAALQRARDLDGFPLTADTRINEIIRQVGDATSGRGGYLADTESRFHQLSPNGVPGSEFFFDAMHVMFPGNYEIAASMFEQLAARVHERFSDHLPDDDLRTYAPISQDECARRMGMSPLLHLVHLQTVLEDLGPIQAVHPEFDIAPIERQLESVQSSLNPNSKDEALQRIDEAIALRPHDGVLLELRNRVSQL